MSCCSQNKGGCKDHHHHHHHQSSCCHNSCGCGCAHSCCHDYEEEESCSKSEKLLEVADLAWLEVLKEKIKDHIRSTDKKIDELAKVVAEANHQRWKQKMENEKCAAHYDDCCEDFEEKLHKLFSCGDSCHAENKNGSNK